MLYRTATRTLGDLISPKALERILSDAARERHTTLAQLDNALLADILKRDVYRRLQLSVPAALAKRRVQEVLDALEHGTDPAGGGAGANTQILTLEDQARRFALYFDWPQTQRLRALLGVAKQEAAAGRDPEALLREGAELIEALERRLSEELVTQGRDLSELKASFARLGGVGGPKIRRLDTLIKQIDEAQEQRTLLPAELERALGLSLDLRKQVESSVVQHLGKTAESGPDEAQTFDYSLLPPEAQARVQSMEREHEARTLQDLTREFQTLLRTDVALDGEVQLLRARSEGGQLLGETVLQNWRARLTEAQQRLLNDQRAVLHTLGERLSRLPDDASVRSARQAYALAQATIQGGGLASDELSQLAQQVQVLEGRATSVMQNDTAELVLAQQRESFELERAAREVPGAMSDLTPMLQDVRQRLASGQTVALEPLWAVLERRMGEAAQQREDMDRRADTVMRDYDRYRHLAGETTQKLGRLADVLRAQRHLGTLSNDARERYLETLVQAEALLSEAQAEFQAAREVTSAFGADALEGLLDVFDTDGPSLGSSSALLSTEPPAPLSGLAALMAAAPSAPAAPDPFGLGGIAPTPMALPGRAWLVVDGQVTQGDLQPESAPLTRHWTSANDCEADVLRLAWLTQQAAELNAQQLTLMVAGCCWLTLPQTDGSVLVSCAPDLPGAQLTASHWKTTLA
ncbi:hypothetical protein [Deinococcus sonorensis]|uniref:Uncharacterized protein n=2 Tax=Deinococcus sonorensis TaxID=309891 RepID=A0AAU7UF30_9DEIO